MCELMAKSEDFCTRSLNRSCKFYFYNWNDSDFDKYFHGEISEGAPIDCGSLGRWVNENFSDDSVLLWYCYTENDLDPDEDVYSFETQANIMFICDAVKGMRKENIARFLLTLDFGLEGQNPARDAKTFDEWVKWLAIGCIEAHRNAMKFKAKKNPYLKYAKPWKPAKKRGRPRKRVA